MSCNLAKEGQAFEEPLDLNSVKSEEIQTDEPSTSPPQPSSSDDDDVGDEDDTVLSNQKFVTELRDGSGDTGNGSIDKPTRENATIMDQEKTRHRDPTGTEKLLIFAFLFIGLVLANKLFLKLLLSYTGNKLYDYDDQVDPEAEKPAAEPSFHNEFQEFE